MRTVYGRG
ncbi:23S rRNA (uracil-5-)-methyltransferase RumB, partial [Yersinia pestis PY-72]